MVKTEAEIINRIREEASLLGACRLTDSFTSFVKGARILFLPHILEFCTSRSFPFLEQWEAMEQTAGGLEIFNIFLNSGKIETEPQGDIALIGKTDGIIRISGCDRRHTVLLMHGASATIIASRYAVVKVEKSNDCKVNIITDSTSIVL